MIIYRNKIVIFTHNVCFLGHICIAIVLFQSNQLIFKFKQVFNIDERDFRLCIKINLARAIESRQCIFIDSQQIEIHTFIKI